MQAHFSRVSDIKKPPVQGGFFGLPLLSVKLVCYIRNSFSVSSSFVIMSKNLLIEHQNRKYFSDYLHIQK